MGKINEVVLKSDSTCKVDDSRVSFSLKLYYLEGGRFCNIVNFAVKLKLFMTKSQVLANKK